MTTERLAIHDPATLARAARIFRIALDRDPVEQEPDEEPPVAPSTGRRRRDVASHVSGVRPARVD